MEDRRRAAHWLRSAYVVYGIIFTGIIGGFLEILSIADYINYGVVKLLEINSSGAELYGKFLFPRNWFTLCVIFILLMCLFPATAILRYFVSEENIKQTEKNLRGEIVSLRQDIKDVIRSSENITNYIYPGDIDLGRFDTKNIDLKYDISDGGNTQVEALITIECTSDPAHFYRYWIDADPESDIVNFFRDLHFEVTDSVTGRRLDWLPVKNGQKNKTFAIFFPEVTPGKQMSLRICFMWPGYMRRLIDLGAASFHCKYLSKSLNARAPLKIEWNFSNKLAKFNCRIAGRHSNTASIHSENRVSSVAWIYCDPNASMGTNYTIEFARSD